MVNNQGNIQSSNSKAALGCARALQLWSGSDSAANNYLPDAIRAYQWVIENGEPSDRAVANNNLGAIYFRQKDYQSAVRALSDPSWRFLPQDKLYLHDYNLGRAIEFDRSPDQAFPYYKSAVQQNPNYLKSYQAAFRLLEQMDQPHIAEAADLIDSLNKSGEPVAARNEAFTLLEKWAGERSADRFLISIVETYTQKLVTPQDFTELDWPKLVNIGNKSPQINPAIQEIHCGYWAHFDISQSVSKSYPYWSHTAERRKHFAAFLMALGGFYESRHELDRAFSSYYSAWALDHNNTEAAITAAALLQDHSPELDPNGNYIKILLEEMLLEKQQAYNKSDWNQIMRAHAVLGTVLEHQGSCESSDERFSAIYHWRRAIEAEQHVRSFDPGLPLQAGLHSHLASCYLQLSDNSSAVKAWLDAAGEFVRNRENSKALEALNQVKKLSSRITLTAEDSARYQAELKLATNKQME
jgi:tetratricopeptide (TPR) repeat protein